LDLLALGQTAHIDRLLGHGAYAANYYADCRPESNIVYTHPAVGDHPTAWISPPQLGIGVRDDLISNLPEHVRKLIYQFCGPNGIAQLMNACLGLRMIGNQPDLYVSGHIISYSLLQMAEFLTHFRPDQNNWRRLSISASDPHFEGMMHLADVRVEFHARNGKQNGYFDVWFEIRQNNKQFQSINDD